MLFRALARIFHGDGFMWWGTASDAWMQQRSLLLWHSPASLFLR